MSAREALVDAVAACLRGRLAEAAVFDAPPVRSTVPYAVVDEPVIGPWGTKSWVGYEARVAVGLWDEGERPVRLRAMLGEVEEAVAGLPPDMAGGWRVARVELVRSRLARGASDRWLARAEFVAWVWRADS
ncbi:tail completion protein gp17 [Sphingomonas lenta]|uniref:DUF3168 domain-containing protein n=1 Tax=Sphingomonas lenta TaxID=1141887 RepID=A0A2A2SCL6_9SPHN|nr:DUF3168 domain-containing protein [Sphingomonas lenta]PAX07006.1 hypothetical protein CKY28_13160 [Sphingomonas lenta]